MRIPSRNRPLALPAWAAAGRMASSAGAGGMRGWRQSEIERYVYALTHDEVRWRRYAARRDSAYRRDPPADVVTRFTEGILAQNTTRIRALVEACCAGAAGKPAGYPLAPVAVDEKLFTGGEKRKT